ncbi:FtsX-like permease family protein [Streptomyces sp. NPDC053367]|uniref:FtsX-like permease family protein n=1 Tax=Streptomyces sp. NPDC053367 TaxID=3365700 RepID=UPI0037D66C1E
MTGFTGAAGFVLLRARAHRLLLAAALLTVLLTTAVLATLTAYSGAIGDAALRQALRDPRNASDTALIVKADVPREDRAAADTAVRDGARRAFGGFPVTVRTLTRSGSYGLPGTAEGEEPDLTYFAALDAAQVRLVSGRLPRPVGGGTARTAGSGTSEAAGGAPIEVAAPQSAAERLRLRPGDLLTLTDRLDGPDVRVRVTGVYRPAKATDPYWELDDLGGRGVKQGGFTTYGPLLATLATVTDGRVSEGPSGWLASADFSTITADRIAALREAALTHSAALREEPALSGATAATTDLPVVLDRVERSRLVSRSTLLIVSLLLVLLALYALLLVARLLSSERAGETRLLRARGASRARVAGHAALEALLLAVPAVVAAPLLAGPLTGLLAGQGALARIGLRLDGPGRGDPDVWLVAGGTALGCALAVTLPALTAQGFRAGRARALPAPLRAGADLALLVVAAVAYWQLDQQDSGAVTDDSSGTLGVDPLLVAAPALALLAGTVLTLRLLPPLARLAERRAAGGRGVAAALAGWQLSRRPMRGAGPVLLLVLAIALGMMAIGQGASWERSQDDQADFRAGAPIRVLAAGDAELGRTDAYAGAPHVTGVAPAVRQTQTLSGNRSATVLALDTAQAADAMLLRPDLAPEPVRPLLSGLGPEHEPAGPTVPAGTTRLRLALSLAARPDSGTRADVTVALVDGHGIPYQLPASAALPCDGRRHTVPVDLPAVPAGVRLTGLELAMPQPMGVSEQHRVTLRGITAESADGTVRPVEPPSSWTATTSTDEEDPFPDSLTVPTQPDVTSERPFTVEYGTGHTPAEEFVLPYTLTVRLAVAQPGTPDLTAVATDGYLTATGARTGDEVDLTFGGETLPVRIVAAVRALPTTPDDHDGAAILVDLRSVDQALAELDSGIVPTEWWLTSDSPRETAAALRARPDLDPAQVLVRDEIAAELRDDPFGAGPGAAFAAAAIVAAALAAVGFAVSAAGSLRERDAEFAVLRALGASRRRLARAIAAEQGVLVGLALLAGAALGAVLARAVIPLIVLTAQATRPVPELRVELPPGRVALLLAAVVVTPLLVTAVLALRRADPATALRQGGE